MDCVILPLINDMSSTEEILRDALNLKAKDKVELIDKLLASLENPD